MPAPTSSSSFRSQRRMSGRLSTIRSPSPPSALSPTPCRWGTDHEHDPPHAHRRRRDGPAYRRPLAPPAVVAWAFPRLHAGAQATVALLLGPLAVALAAEAVNSWGAGGLSGDDFTGLLGIPATRDAAQTT